MKVASLHIYPVKGIHAVDLQEAAVEKRGLLHDRRWMIVDAAGKFITQREMPKLATLRADITQAGLRLHYDQDSIDVAAPRNTETMQVRVWKTEVMAKPADGSVNQWLGDYMGSTVALVFQDDAHRPISKEWSNPGDETSFADDFPLLIAHTASLDDLNRRMPKPLPMNRFRPNIVIDGKEPWVEDTWKRIRIGGVEIDIVKPCVRCIVTTTDQESGTRDGAEPIATLKTFRLSKQPGIAGVLFAQNAIPRSFGGIRVGDKVEVLQTQNPPLLANVS